MSRHGACSGCGAINKADSDFCDSCGTVLAHQHSCPNCEVAFDSSGEYCDACGAPRSGGGPSSLTKGLLIGVITVVTIGVVVALATFAPHESTDKVSTGGELTESQQKICDASTQSEAVVRLSETIPDLLLPDPAPAAASVAAALSDLDRAASEGGPLRLRDSIDEAERATRVLVSDGPSDSTVADVASAVRSLGSEIQGICSFPLS